MRHWLKYSAVLALCIAGAIFAVGIYYKYGIKTPERLIQIPETNFSVILRGPDEKGHYRYDVLEKTHVVAERFLGPITPTSATATVSTQSDGIVRLDWGSHPSAGFILLDFNERKVVRDSNSGNMPNEPFLSIPAAPSSPPRRLSR
jgi:hypothetical protein